MKIIRYKYKDPEKSWFKRIFKKQKPRWSSEKFNGILKFTDSHIDYSKVMCIYMTPDLFTVFSVLSREPKDTSSGSHYLIAKIDNFNLFQAFPESPAIPVAADPYIALTPNNNEICSYIMFKYNNGDIVFVTFEKLKLFNEFANATF